jgi:hypothetical protein
VQACILRYLLRISSTTLVIFTGYPWFSSDPPNNSATSFQTLSNLSPITIPYDTVNQLSPKILASINNPTNPNFQATKINFHLCKNLIHLVVKETLTAQSDYGIQDWLIVARFPTETKPPETNCTTHTASCSMLSGGSFTRSKPDHWLCLMKNLGMSEGMLLLLPYMLLWCWYEQLYCLAGFDRITGIFMLVVNTKLMTRIKNKGQLS